MAEVLNNANEQLEQRELTADIESCNRMIDEYQRCIDDARKSGNLDMVDYYKEKMAPLKEARNQAQTKYWENKKEQYAQEAQELQHRIQQDNIKRRTPTYGNPTTEEGWLHRAEITFKENGESWYYRICMAEAAKCHVREAFEGK